MQALEELDYLAALDNDGNLSEIGIVMSELPLEPQMAKTVLASCEFDCVSEVLIIAAMLAGITPRLPVQSTYRNRFKKFTFLWIFFFPAPSCISVPPVQQKPAATQCHMTFRHPEGDHFTLVNIYKAFKQRQQDPCQFRAHTSMVVLIFSELQEDDSFNVCGCAPVRL